MVDVAVEHLILNLLALAESAERLSPAARERLAALAAQVAPDEDALARVGANMLLELYEEPAFRQALAAWQDLAPERYGLSLDAIQEELSNPEPMQASGAERLPPLESLAQVTREALQDPVTFAHREVVLRALASLLGLRWPP